MRSGTGREMKSLILAISIMTTVLVLAVIAYFMIDGILTANDNMEHNKQKMIDQAVVLLQQMTGRVSNVGANAELVKYFNQDIPNQILSGNVDIFYSMVVRLGTSLYPIDYCAIIKNGQIIEDRSRSGIVVDGSTIPVSDSESGSFTLNSLGGRQGFFIGVYFSTNLSMYGLGTMHGVAIVDRTAELADIENFFADQRNSQVMGMSIAAIVALVLTILLTTLGLRYFTNKYVVKPIRELNQTAEAIIDGTFEGQVEVDRDSAYYALQGLLESGQKVLRHVDEKMLDQEE